MARTDHTALNPSWYLLSASRILVALESIIAIAITTTLTFTPPELAHLIKRETPLNVETTHLDFVSPRWLFQATK